MTKPARQEYTAAVRRRYLAADREGKSRILEEYCRTLRCHRKAAIRALRREPQARRRVGRRVTYDRAVVPVLEQLWRVGDRLCGKLLAPALRTLLPALERHGLRLAPAHRVASARILSRRSCTHSTKAPGRKKGSDDRSRTELPCERSWARSSK